MARGDRSLSIGDEVPESGGCRVMECFGLPGAGKSYLAEQICAHLKGAGLQVGGRAMLLGLSGTTNRILEKVGLILLALWKNRSANHIAWRLIRLYQPSSYRAFLKLIFNWLYICALIRSEVRNSDAVVLDQGIGQALWSTDFHSRHIPDREVVASLLVSLIQELQLSNLEILHVSANEECIKNRIQSRLNGNSPLDRNPGLWIRAVAVTGRVRIILDDVVRLSESISIIDINNNGQALDIALRSVVSADNTGLNV